jgi:hypothetical protein
MLRARARLVAERVVDEREAVALAGQPARRAAPAPQPAGASLVMPPPPAAPCMPRSRHNHGVNLPKVHGVNYPTSTCMVLHVLQPQGRVTLPYLTLPHPSNASLEARA